MHPFLFSQNRNLDTFQRMTLQFLAWIRKDLQGFYWLPLSLAKKECPGWEKLQNNMVLCFVPARNSLLRGKAVEKRPRRSWEDPLGRGQEKKCCPLALCQIPNERLERLRDVLRYSRVSGFPFPAAEGEPLGPAYILSSLLYKYCSLPNSLSFFFLRLAMVSQFCASSRNCR